MQFNSVDHYQSEIIFNEERESIFARLPAVAAHACEIPRPGDFVKRQVAGRSIIVTRDAAGARAFLNVCRHRGTQLVSEIWMQAPLYLSLSCMDLCKLG